MLFLVIGVFKLGPVIDQILVLGHLVIGMTFSSVYIKNLKNIDIIL